MAKKLTPMMEQYLAIKERYQEELLFFRLGDFYELFFDDALTASQELNITLTGRAAGQEDKAPMCGVPFHAAESYILKLIQKGYKVAICEQIEDPATTKGLVKRDVVRVITPGTLLSENGTATNDNNFLAVFYQVVDTFVMLFADISTGEVIWFQQEMGEQHSAMIDALAMYTPAEIVLVGSTKVPEEVHSYVENHMSRTVFTRLDEHALQVAAGDYAEHLAGCEQWPALTLDGLSDFGREHFATYCAVEDPVYATLGALYMYLVAIIKVQAQHMTHIHAFDAQNRLLIDASCLRHLEITRNLRDGGVKGTLFQVLDRTKTPMGMRLLKQWVENPLLDVTSIEARQDGVQELLDKPQLREELSELLRSIFDFERILTRVETGSVSPRDMVSLRESFAMLPAIKSVLGGCHSTVLRKLLDAVQTHAELHSLLESAIAETPATTMKDGGVIRDGYDEELDELRGLATNSQAWLQRLEDDIKERTGIRLKTGYNKVFGYYFEVSHANASQVPEYFIRKQTLANAERYITPELKEFEIKILSAKDRIVVLEQKIFARLRETLRKHLEEIQRTARALAEIDVFRSLAEVAFVGRYIRPSLNRQGRILIRDGRHPVIESFLRREAYVPNDVILNHEDHEFLLITGPNMAGKSTYMRQVAILMIMAQMGSFIPAGEASISPVDKIFTRVGASDDISTGQSTFMVEMKEVAYILENATANSLIILDEIGRGTSTFDGLSIAKAVVEYIVKNIKAKTLFATHYHELIAMETDIPKLKNYTVAVKEKGKDVLFLRRIVKGGADRSYGIHVAKLAGLPPSVLQQAERILSQLEEQGVTPGAASLPKLATTSVAVENPLGNLFTHSLLDELKTLDLLSMTPIEALNTLYRLQEEARKGEGT